MGNLLNAGIMIAKQHAHKEAVRAKGLSLSFRQTQQHRGSDESCVHCVCGGLIYSNLKRSKVQ